MALCREDMARELAPRQEDYTEPGERLLGTIILRAGRVKSTTFTICARAPFQAGTAVVKPSDAAQQEVMHTSEVPNLTLKMAKGLRMVEGCGRTKDPHMEAHHIRSGIEESMGGMLHKFGRDPEALTAAGHSAPTAQAFTSRVLAV